MRRHAFQTKLSLFHLLSRFRTIDEILRASALEGYLGLPPNSIINRGWKDLPLEIDGVNPKMLAPGSSGLEKSLRMAVAQLLRKYYPKVSGDNLESYLPDFSLANMIYRKEGKPLPYKVGEWAKRELPLFTVGHLVQALKKYILKSPGTVSNSWRALVEDRHPTSRPFLQNSLSRENGDEDERDESRDFERTVRTKGLNRYEENVAPPVLSRLHEIIERNPALEGEIREYIKNHPPKALFPKEKNVWIRAMIGILLEGETLSEIRSQFQQEGMSAQQLSNLISASKLVGFASNPEFLDGLQKILGAGAESLGVGYSRVARKRPMNPGRQSPRRRA